MSVQELHNDPILPIFKGSLFCSRNEGGKVCIGNMSLRKYIPIYINPMINIINITCGYKTCISAMLLQSDLNKLMLSLLAKLDELYNNSASTRLLQISKINFIEYNNQIFPKNTHIHLSAWDSVS